MTFDRTLIRERTTEAFNRRLLDPQLRNRLRTKNATRKEIIELYEALYVDTAESLANTTEAFKEEEQEASFYRNKAGMLERDLAHAKTEWNRYQHRCEALLKLLTLAVSKQDPEDLI